VSPGTTDEQVSIGAPSGDGRFHLAGRSIHLDPRVHAIRSDLADVALAGVLFAPHYARPRIRRLTALSAPLRANPKLQAGAVSELLMGEEFAVVDVAGGWAWGYCRHDHYVGYLPAELLGEAAAPTHVVSAPAALVFERADIKSPVVARWAMGVRFSGLMEDGFVRSDAGFIHARHVTTVDAADGDPVAIALSLVGQPYRWGGRSGDGLDCSGLIQLALAGRGIAAPRDSDQQRNGLGVLLDDNASLRRGDLVFFPGHVGLMVDGERIVHANAYWMAVTVEPLADVVARLAGDHDQPILARRRLK